MGEEDSGHSLSYQGTFSSSTDGNEGNVLELSGGLSVRWGSFEVLFGEEMYPLGITSSKSKKM